ncbi:MAG: TIR domain-containing protein [Cyanobium sp.]
MANADRRFAVGFSYAGEQRELVAPLAERLAKRLTEERVLFDRFHEAELARPDLDVYLPRLYRDHTTLIVVVLSPEYSRKRWCGLEWRWIRQLILESAQERIMLLRLGDPGDLSELGIVAGDGYLDIARRPAAEVVARIEQRMRLEGIPLPPEGEAPGPPDSWAAAGRRWLSRRWPLLASLSGGGALLTALLLAPAWLARWQVDQGDRAFAQYAKGDGSQWERAAEAWQKAAQLDRRSAAAQARLGFLADLRGELAPAESAWRRALELQPDPNPEARRHRIGLANVVMQQPGRRAEALRLFDGNNDYPRAAVEAAMLRWQDPGQLPQALDAVNSPALATALAGPAGTQREAWSFRQGDQLLVFENLGHQRCLLQNVRATTAHQLGRGPTSPPLTMIDCQGIENQVRELLCTRLQLATFSSNLRAPLAARWLSCFIHSREQIGKKPGALG